MTQSWMFYAYAPQPFAAHFHGQDPSMAETLVEALLWDEDAWSDVTMVRRLCEQIARHGLSYEGLSPVEAECLDQMLPSFFVEEGLAGPLHVEALSFEGLSPELPTLLAARRPGDDLWQALAAGRRFGQRAGSACGYCLFSAEECATLLAELRSMQASAQWPSAWMHEAMQEEWIAPLAEAARSGRPLLAVLA